jgi:ATP/maltotriose-dependent transcriptional regulator MalT
VRFAVVASEAHHTDVGGPVVGRERELDELGAFAAGIGARPRSLLLAGDAGAGKTTLWEAALRRAEEAGAAILAARPLEAETKLAYSGLADLLAACRDAIEAVPEPQARALRAALLLEAPADGTVDARAVSLGFHGVVRALARDRPVMLAVDDVHWLDGPSAATLVFAARRLEPGEPVGILLALRAEHRGSLSFDPARVLPAFTELTVGPLEPEELHVLLQDRLGTTLPRPVLRRLAAASGGNPFYALELARALGAERGPVEAAPLPPTLRELVGARVASLPAPTRSALLAASASPDPTLALVGETAGLDAAEALGPAVAAEIVSMSGGRLRFAHPLLAAAAYDLAAPAERRDVHVRLAALAGDAEERARHLALAATAPDEAVAAALESAAAQALSRGAPSAAAELLEEARALTPTGHDADAARRAVDAAWLHFAAGDAQRARALVEEALAGLPPGPERARAQLVLGRVRSYDDDLRAAIELFERALTEAHDDAAVEALAREAVSASLFRLRERFADAVEHARAAAEIATRLGDDELRSAALGSQLIGEATLGLERARVTMRAATAAAAAGSRLRVLQGSAFPVGVVRMWWEELDEACLAFAGLLAEAADVGDESSAPYLHVLLAQAECLRGRFDAAAAHAAEAALRAEQGGQLTLLAYAVALQALVHAHRGEEEQAREAHATAMRLASSTAGRPAEQFATAALGLLELSLEHDEAAVAALEPLVRHAGEHEMNEPGLTRFVPDYVEALVGLGRLDEADGHLERYAGHAERLERRSAQGAAARCRSLLAAARGDLDAARAQLGRALELHQASPIPFDRARTLLALGAAQRRAKERRDARASLTAARDLFRGLGAGAWVPRAEAELRRIGGRAPALGELTPIERRVAELVAAGRTNREVAAALFLSPRTVEGHLSHVYGKLGVRSRVELSRKLA